MTMKAKPPADRSRALRLAATLLGLSVTLGACKTFDAPIVAAEPYPDDYRLRHPIAVREKAKTLTVFIGDGRGTLTPTQRAEVGAMGPDVCRFQTRPAIGEQVGKARAAPRDVAHAPRRL